MGKSHIIILVDERNISDAPTVVCHELAVTRGSLIARVCGQHALDAHTHALDGLYGRPAGGTEEIEADDAVTVDVGVHGN